MLFNTFFILNLERFVNELNVPYVFNFQEFLVFTSIFAELQQLT